MYHGAIILLPHRRIKHLRTVYPDSKEQITIWDHSTIGLFHLLTLTLKWVRQVLLEKYKYFLHTDYTLRSKMGNCAIKQWQLTVQQSCKKIPCFSTCCKGEVNVQIVSDDGKDLDPGVVRSKQSRKLRWKRSGMQSRKSSIPKNNMKKSGNMVEQTIHLHYA